MSKIAFIDILFHEKTKSSRFMIDLLEREGHQVDLYYIGLDVPSMLAEIASVDYDLIVCWQTEYVAPYFILKSKRVICIPMWDGVGQLPDEYWLQMKQARFVCFSEALHNKLTALNIDSFKVQYFLNPDKFQTVSDYSSKRFFFWERRPEEGLDKAFAQSFVKAHDHLHLHIAPDTAHPEGIEEAGNLSVTYYAESPKPYLDALAEANIYICPRITEGIGMGMLEALSRGMCVVAHNDATANEYIQDGVDGLLIDYTEKERPDMSTILIRQLGTKAYQRAVKGYEKWQSTIPQLLYFIQTCPEPYVAHYSKGLENNFLRAISLFDKDVFKYIKILQSVSLDGMRQEDTTELGIKGWIKFYLIRNPFTKMLWLSLHYAKWLFYKIPKAVFKRSKKQLKRIRQALR